MIRRLRAGDLVEVKSLPEILSTLDSSGTLDGMPFMPEMAQFCGRRLRVAARAHKTCDTVNNTGGVRVRDAVHLENARCDGSSHGGCQAFCLTFWKEAWLKPVGRHKAVAKPTGDPAAERAEVPAAWSYQPVPFGKSGRLQYRCQITELPRFTTPLAWWDVRQYWEDLTSGNVSLALFFRGLRFSLFRAWINHGFGYRLTVKIFNWIQHRRGASSFPFVEGPLQKTPHRELGLKPGEHVRVKEFDQIVATLDKNCKNRGLGFDTCEMRLHCKGEFRVKSRIDKILNEKTGELMVFPTPCITLEDVYCVGETTQRRLFCPRAITPYWREIWLERTGASESGAPVPETSEVAAAAAAQSSV